MKKNILLIINLLFSFNYTINTTYAMESDLSNEELCKLISNNTHIKPTNKGDELTYKKFIEYYKRLEKLSLSLKRIVKGYLDITNNKNKLPFLSIFMDKHKNNKEFMFFKERIDFTRFMLRYGLMDKAQKMGKENIFKYYQKVDKNKPRKIKSKYYRSILEKIENIFKYQKYSKNQKKIEKNYEIENKKQKFINYQLNAFESLRKFKKNPNAFIELYIKEITNATMPKDIIQIVLLYINKKSEQNYKYIDIPTNSNEVIN